MTDEQPSLFPVADTPVRRAPRAAPANARPVWSKYRPVHPVKCDDCMTVLALAKGNAPASRQARFRRKAGATDLLLCYGHAQQRRDDDGLGPIEW